jgi:hypothetical protein
MSGGREASTQLFVGDTYYITKLVHSLIQLYPSVPQQTSQHIRRTFLLPQGNTGLRALTVSVLIGASYRVVDVLISTMSCELQCNTTCI